MFSKLIYKLYNKEAKRQEIKEENDIKVPRNMMSRGISKFSDFDAPNPTHITLYKAVGGHIVKFRNGNFDEDQFSKSSSGPKETVYIINDDEDLKEALALCITAEALKR